MRVYQCKTNKYGVIRVLAATQQEANKKIFAITKNSSLKAK